MSKRSAKPAGPVTRKQQVAALRATKGQEVAASVAVQVASQMKELVDKAVEAKFKSVLDTMTDLIDYLEADEQFKDYLVAMKAYRDEYGV